MDCRENHVPGPCEQAFRKEGWGTARGMGADTPLKVLCFGFVAE